MTKVWTIEYGEIREHAVVKTTGNYYWCSYDDGSKYRYRVDRDKAILTHEDALVRFREYLETRIKTAKKEVEIAMLKLERFNAEHPSPAVRP